MNQIIMDKLKVLAEGAKYDVSCASSGVEKKNSGTIGNSSAGGICHTWTADGRCISLLKILMSNDCVYDCEYCVNRLSNDIPRTSFEPEEIAELMIEFYRRNYIEGLFLSSAVDQNPNFTMEHMVRALEIIRHTYHFSGYIHIKAIPGADPLLIQRAGLLADRMSVNMELPSEGSLKLLAPQKSLPKLVAPMKQIRQGIQTNLIERKSYRSAPKFVPAGQSTQMIIGATPDSDLTIINTTDQLYKRYELKRVYYSAYIPVNAGTHLPSVMTTPPMVREHRLYQADWLLRFYEFDAHEIVHEGRPNLDLDFDPKMTWALEHMALFPVEINQADYHMLLRVPGIGVTSAQRIIKQRKVSKVQYEDLMKMHVPVKRSKYFITCDGKFYGDKSMEQNRVRQLLLPDTSAMGQQLTLWG